MKQVTIKTINLNKMYGKIHAVSDFNFEASKGEIIALLGPNGAGKSTLMNMMTGFLSPTSGDIFIDGENIKQNPLKAKEKIGFLPEGAPIYPDMSVKMFLNYMRQLRGATKERLSEVIKIANIENVLFQKVETLSKGYLRRVGFAQSILSDPEILFLDEPTDGLDPNQKEHMQNLISQMGKNKTILISTHLLDEAQTIADRIVVINHGKIVIDGTLAQIKEKTKTKSLAEAFKKLTNNKGK
ncbi:MAG: ABC transporter ATP-binding protein [Alphaproteobacteria bacterium]|nr:ABC transporter ATP-binding protein [Alphaproteobacteria bacterium]